ncbi:MAG: tyrosine--tRNA ligase [Anaerolineae bacterium]|jgi:tyrosyl-tRNA synthetase|nr:tyrosine--tRNA ligase [Anaerolineae bacterium]
MAAQSAFDEFCWRGLVYDSTEGLSDALVAEKVTVYIGFDPTADSLQVGNLLALMGLARMQRFGHSPIALAGGGTGMIGDPGGKTSERQLMSIDQVQANVEAIKLQLARYLDFEVRGNPARLVNNADWLLNVPMMAFLRDVGKHFTVSYMTSKDSVKTRLQREEGISYAEFSYMLLQAYDFQQLFDRYGCTLQAGGSDQWGNITAGVELIRRTRDARAYGLVYPLATDTEGVKLGKTVRGAIWLDAAKTSPFRYYQFWLNQGDDVVISFLKYFTWLDQEAIVDLEQKLEAHPERRDAQRALAQEVTRLTHGETALAKAEQASQVLFGGEIAGLDASEIADIFSDVPSSDVPRSRFEGNGSALIDLFEEAGLARSKGEARRLLSNGGVYINNIQVTDPARAVALQDATDGQFIVLRKGKKQYHLLRLVE